jgi:hypothetical protein
VWPEINIRSAERQDRASLQTLAAAASENLCYRNHARVTMTAPDLEQKVVSEKSLWIWKEQRYRAPVVRACFVLRAR